MKKVLIFALVLLVCISLFSCSNQDFSDHVDLEAYTGTEELGEYRSLRGTSSFIAVDADPEYSDYFSSRLEELLSKWNPGNPNGEIGMLNNTRGSSHLSGETVTLLKRCFSLSKQTDGKLDITLYPLTRLWGFDSDAPKKPEIVLISLLISKCGMDTFSVTNNAVSLEQFTMLDPSAVVNGYAADLISDELLNLGCKGAMLQIEDHVRIFGKKANNEKWNVKLNDPFENKDCFGSILLQGNCSVSTKGSFQHYFQEDGKRYCNILDPKSGHPVDNDLVSATVICKDGIDADAFATACFILGSKDAAKFYEKTNNVELILVLKNGEVHVSEGIVDSFMLVDSDTKVKVIKK